MDKLLELIGVHGPVAGCILALGTVLGLHMRKDEHRHEVLQAKASAAASRDELVRIHHRIDALGTQQADQHSELLGHLIRLKQREP